MSATVPSTETGKRLFTDIEPMDMWESSGVTPADICAIEDEAARDAIAGVSLLMGASSPMAANEAKRLLRMVERAVTVPVLRELLEEVVRIYRYDNEYIERDAVLAAIDRRLEENR